MIDSGSTEPTAAQGHTLGFGCASLYGLPGKRERAQYWKPPTSSGSDTSTSRRSTGSA